MSDALEMSVSQIFRKDGEKFAYVSFSDGSRRAEGMIPDCKIHTNSGFSEDEVSQLEAYMGRELMTLKNMAAGIHVMDAFLS